MLTMVYTVTIVNSYHVRHRGLTRCRFSDTDTYKSPSSNNVASHPFHHPLSQSSKATNTRMIHPPNSFH